MDKTPNYIKKTLAEAKAELLKNEKLRVSREAYVQKLKEIFTEKVIELNDGIGSKMSSTGTGTSEVISQSIDTSSKANIAKRNTQKDNKIIFLNNEVIGLLFQPDLTFLLIILSLSNEDHTLPMIDSPDLQN